MSDDGIEHDSADRERDFVPRGRESGVRAEHRDERRLLRCFEAEANYIPREIAKGKTCTHCKSDAITAHQTAVYGPKARQRKLCRHQMT